MALSSQKIERLEWFGIFLNNGLLLIGMPLLGWAFFDILFLHWLELPVACLLWLTTEWGLAVSFKKALAKRILQGLALLLLTAILLSLGLFWAASSADLAPLADLGIWGQLPTWLWANDLFWLALLFLVAYLLPVVLLWRQGIPPLREQLPAQSQIMSHWLQWLLNPFWLLLVFLLQGQFTEVQPFWWVLVLVLGKTATEAFLLWRLLKKRQQAGQH